MLFLNQQVVEKLFDHGHFFEALEPAMVDLHMGAVAAQPVMAGAQDQGVGNGVQL